VPVVGKIEKIKKLLIPVIFCASDEQWMRIADLGS
jgi:hypothetical protein